MSNVERNPERYNPEKALARKISAFGENCAVVPGVDPENGDPLMSGIYRIAATRHLPSAELLVRCRYGRASSSSRLSGCEIVATDPTMEDDGVLLRIDVEHEASVRIDGQAYSEQGHQSVTALLKWIEHSRLEPDVATCMALAEREKLRAEVVGILEFIDPDQYLPDSGQTPLPEGE